MGAASNPQGQDNDWLSQYLRGLRREVGTDAGKAAKDYARGAGVGLFGGVPDFLYQGMYPTAEPLGATQWLNDRWGATGSKSEGVGGLFGVPNPAGAAAKTGLLAGGLLGTTGKVGKGVIRDWRWRPMADVRSDVGLVEIPDYIQRGYGQFMTEQASKAKDKKLGARDLIKAYGITRSSVNRGARQIEDDLVSSAEQVRPEGYMAEWLLSPSGQRYLDSAQKGSADEAAIADIVKRFRSFGMADTLGGDLRYAATELAPINGSINNAVAGSKDEWRNVAQSLRGIGPSKSGFIASLLGRGDLPTFDARQIALHTGNPSADASKYIRRGNGAGGDAAVDRLARRQEQMGLGIDPSLRPHYQHLSHHAVWDKVGGSKTTHDDLVRAMKYGLFAGAAAVPWATAEEQP